MLEHRGQMAEPVADICVIRAGRLDWRLIFAAERQPALRVEVLDGATSVGKKKFVSGGGAANRHA